MNSDAQVEINMFLRATEMNQTNINLGGFFDVNRTLFKSVSILKSSLLEHEKFLRQELVIKSFSFN